MRFFLLGDIHMPAGDAEAAQRLRASLRDMRAIDPDAALAVVGDYSLNGRPEEQECFFDLLDAEAPEHTFVILGNHDARGPDSADWNRERTRVSAFWPTARALYLRRGRPYRTSDELYFSWDGGDARLIFLNPENGLKDVTELSAAQLSWLRGELAAGAAAGQRLFVFAHQPLWDTHWHSNLYGGFGAQDAAVKDILSGYPQTVFVCGHIHNPFGVAEAVDRPYGTQLETPAFGAAGSGYCVETDETETRVRARSFAPGEWLLQYDIRLPVPGLPELCPDSEWLRRVYEPYDPDDDDGLPAAPLYGPEVRREIFRLAASLRGRGR